MSLKLNLNKNKGYLLFHINTSFSSIEESQIIDLLKNCYWPLLKMIKKLKIKTAIEITGKSLLKIHKLDPSWTGEFKKLIKLDLVELVGSGYCQIIGPLAPYELNLKNQILGLQEYKTILNIVPKVALVNEMSYSSGVVDFYVDAGYEGLIMERNNIALANNKNLLEIEKINYAKGTNRNKIKVLWSDSILFQRFQRYAHGEISLNDYLKDLNSYKNKFYENLPIYTNDAEVFNFRPGRFKDESLSKDIDEWKRIELLLKKLASFGLVFDKPSKLISSKKNRYIKKLNSSSYPAPVKKQPKYNLSRWALSGRNDVWINTICYRIFNKLNKDYSNREDYWRKLCELWSSDLRTHITSKRWQKAQKKIINMCKEIKISHELNYKDNKKLNSKRNKNLFAGKINKKNDSNTIEIKTNFLKIELNLKKGLAISSLAYKKHNFKEIIGSLPATYYENIEYGADFFSGGLLVEVPKDRRRYTDYYDCNPKIRFSKNTLYISAKINIGYIQLEKTLIITDNQEKIKIEYKFLDTIKGDAVIRLGNFIFTDQHAKNYHYETLTGGKKLEKFSLKNDFDHSLAVSSLVSSKTCVPSNSGEIIFNSDDKRVKFEWDNEEVAMMPLIVNKNQKPLNFLRLIFSISEIDDTSKSKEIISKISLSVMAVK